MRDKDAGMETHIYLDDIRTPPFGWKLVKNYNECIAELSKGKVQYLSLDHDLGEEHYTDYHQNIGYINYGAFREKTGYDVCLWLIDNWDVMPNLISITLHTANPVGRINMRQMLVAHKPDHIQVYG